MLFQSFCSEGYFYAPITPHFLAKRSGLLRSCFLAGTVAAISR
jgi:hypothetical protein